MSKSLVNSAVFAAVVASIIFTIYLWTWFILPRIHGKKVGNLPVSKVSK